MKRKRIVRTAEVTIETEENIVLRSGPSRRATTMWCQACRRQVEMVTPEQAAQIARVTTRTIYRWVEAAGLHFSEAPDGSLVICQRSLSHRK